MPALPIRHVLITGGSRGLGLSIAQLFSQNSYRCTLVSRNAATLDSALLSLAPIETAPDTDHQQHGWIAGDISSAGFWDESDFGEQFSQSRGGRVDVLINCAGVTQSSVFARTAPETIQRVVDTNLTGMMLGTRFLLRKRLFGAVGATGGGGGPVIINMASLLGVKGGVGAVAYAASKAGVLGFTRALAQELGSSGTRVNAIVPGYISTDMTADLEKSESLLKKIPAGRFGRPEEIAEAALFLAKNEYANNCVINLDGGLSAT